MNSLLVITLQDIKLAFKKGSSTANLLAFFVIAVSLFPFGIGSDAELLRLVGVGIIWVCALLSSMLAVPQVFDDDYEDGTLAQLMLQGILPELAVISKIFSHWLISSVPLIIITPLLAVLFHIEDKILPLVAALFIGTPTLSIIGSVGASLTLGLKRGGGLAGIIVLPLYIPVLIFGVATAQADVQAFTSNILLMLGILLFMLPVGVLACSAAVKMALEDG